jgi:exo-beta-1,3-glucanase (GH17 family)/cellulose synthase/poly-beta-1,6-N-acetylglucosamine synthase-like glycosyltransferase
MNLPSLIITLIMGALAILLWRIVNEPDNEPPWPAQVQGFSFSPLRAQHNPNRGFLPSIAEIDEDLALLAGDTHALRTYSVEGTLAEVPRLAGAHDLNVALGAWLDADHEGNLVEIDRLIRVYRENHRRIVRVIVGNEVLLRKEQTVAQMIAYLRRVRAAVWAPISLAEPWHIWLEQPELVKEVDYLAVHLLPYWEGVPVDSAVDYIVKRYEELRRAYPDKPIVIAEVGWPSKGRIRQGAVPSGANQAKFLRRFLAVAERERYVYYVLEAFDQLWKRQIEGEAGTYWGVYNNQREPKFEFTKAVVRVPDWQELAAVATGLAVVLLALLFRDSAGLKPRGRAFLALLAYAITAFAVWLVYDFTQQYITWPTLIVGVALMVAALGVIIVLLAEAHEWAEAVWLSRWRRSPKPLAVAIEDLPHVSIHVPAYNEPPDMLIQTLDALAVLDYPSFEVLVIDNNTKDPAIWQPVKAHCERLGERFRFFHVDPLSGFKAGALNFALRKTHPDAEIVAVIDSDYSVSPGWLRDLVTHFGDPNIAIVQAPQDYRDDAENAFKAMCMAEYRGFFQIGMITRNERNAIIQHGTMTMVRRRVLQEVNGWAEWCITEDAELGLRIFERGYAATYIPQTYGQGLIPDTFLDFKKQRFRWAYGAVLIMRHHLMALLGLKKTELSAGQRYHFVAGWLPWLADGFNLVFNLGALAWSVSMIWWPEHVAPPHMVFAVLPLTLFVFKLLKMAFLYRQRVAAGFRQSLAAGIAGLALSHVIARAMVTGFITRKVGFFRTPKRVQANALWRAIADAREESLLLLAMALAATVLLTLRPDADMLDVRIWSAVIVVQAIPYGAALLMSLISGLPRLPAALVGSMGRLSASSQHPVL